MNKRIVEKIYSIVDYKKVFHWSLKNFPSLTEELLKSAKVSKKTDPLHYLLTFIQQLKYKRPAKYYRSRFINNFFPPIVCLYEQYGDCDTKSLLLTEFICSAEYREEKTAIVLIRQTGLNHAILTIKRIPYPGMTSLFFHGKGYFVVLESSAVGWAPGFVSKRILQALKSGRFAWIEL